MKKRDLNIIDNIKRKKLLFVVFITGACLLILEIVATRILSPYFGNTIFTTTSVIGVVLAALSFGYYYGGIYADRNSSVERFYRLILFAGLSVIFLQILNIFLIPVITYEFSIRTGPLIVSIILFLTPSFLLGMLSPFAIKLHEKNNKKTGIGKLTGEVFFASTLGSIFGTFLAGYFLIPNFGIRSVVIGVGLTLSIIGFFGSFRIIMLKNFIFSLLLTLILFSFSLINQSTLRGQVYIEDGIYERLSVVDLDYKGRPARILLQDASFGSGILLDGSENLVFDYTHYYKLYRLANKQPDNALFIGAGAYTMPNKMVQEVPGMVVDVVDIEPKLYGIAQNYFGLEETHKIKNNISDGRRFLYEVNKNYDFIFSDVYYSYSIPVQFTTAEFFELSYDKLSNEGVFVANIIGDLSPDKNSLTFRLYKTFSESFENSYLFAVDSPKSMKPQNFIFVGLKNTKNLLTLLNESDDRFLNNLGDKLVDTNKYNMESYMILTDDFAPIEALTAGFLLRSEKEIN